MFKSENVLPFPLKRRQRKQEDVRSRCENCQYKIVSNKLLKFAVQVVNEIPLPGKSICERRGI